jgi:hypothetical protein
MVVGNASGFNLAGTSEDYLAGFTLRFNRRKSASRSKLFYRLAQQAMQVKPAPYAPLAKNHN